MLKHYLELGHMQPFPGLLSALTLESTLVLLKAAFFFALDVAATVDVLCSFLSKVKHMKSFMGLMFASLHFCC